MLCLTASWSNKEALDEDLHSRTLLLVDLASRARISELEAVTQDKGNIVSLPSGETINTQQKIFSKNKEPQKCWRPEK